MIVCETHYIAREQITQHALICSFYAFSLPFTCLFTSSPSSYFTPSSLHHLQNAFLLQICQTKVTNIQRVCVDFGFLSILQCVSLRVFSALKLVKTDCITSLKSWSLVSLLQYRMKMKNEKLSAAKLQPDKHLLELAYTMKANVADQEVKDLKKVLLDKFPETE